MNIRLEKIKQAISAARDVQEFLWSKMNKSAGFEEWKRMLRKRLIKIENLDTSNPHFQVELRKRLLQMAACSIAFLEEMEKREIKDEIHPSLESNLPEYSKKVD
jgi:hypothetical protein